MCRPLTTVALTTVMALCLVPGAAVPVAAQGSDDELPFDPPVFDAGAGPMSLLEAVRLTLDNDPNLLLSAEDVRFQGGIARELAGAFDWTLRGQLSWEHREQELRDSQRQAEEDKRNQYRDAQALACGAEAELGLKLEELAAAQTMPGVDISTDTGFDAQLQLLEALIQAAAGGNRARERQLLDETRLNLIQTEIDKTAQGLAAATQGCRETTETLERIGEVPEEEEFDFGRLNLRMEKLTRSGISWAPFFNGAYDSTQFVGKRNGFFVPAENPNGGPLFSPSGIPLERLIDFGGKNIEDLHTMELGFEVNLPVLRGRGRAATGAFETAANIDYEASEMVLAFGASQSVLNTVFAYWNLVGSQETRAIFERSVELERRLVEITRDLIDADELPGSEMSRALASQANAQARLESAGRDQIAASTELLRAIGLTTSSSAALPEASDGYPPAPTRSELAAAAEAELVRQSLQNRLDLDAADKLVESGKVLARAAQIDLRPQFDVRLRGWTIARGESSFSTAADNVAAPSYRIGLFLEKPIRNDFAKGRLAQQESLLRQRMISTRDLERLIQIGVVDVHASLTEALAQLDQAQEAVRNYEQTMQTEIDKLQAGETTLINAILTEQQWTRSFLDRLSAQLQVAVLLVQLRFETGTLVARGSGGNRVTQESLTTLPGTQ